MPELALDDVQRHALAGELERVRVAQLVRREPAPDACLGGEPAQLAAYPGAGPGPPAGGAVDDAEQRSDGQLGTRCEPRAQVLPAPLVHADFSALAALAVSDQQRTPPGVEVALCECERFVNAQAAAPEHNDHRAQPPAVTVTRGVPHDRDDLLDGRWVGRVPDPLVARRATGVIARHRRGRAAPTGGIENYGDGHGDLLPIAQRTGTAALPTPARHREVTAEMALPLPLGKARAAGR